MYFIFENIVCTEKFIGKLLNYMQKYTPRELPCRGGDACVPQ